MDSQSHAYQALSDLEITQKMDIEKRRKQKGVWFTVIGFILLFLAFLSILLSWEIEFLLAIAGIICEIIGVLIFASAVTAVKKIISENLVSTILHTVFDDLTYNNTIHIKRSDIENTYMLDQEWDSISGNDYVEGTYKGSHIKFSDIQLVYTGEEEETLLNEEKQKEKNSITIFKGPWLICDFGKTLSADLILRRKERLHIQNSLFKKSMMEIETENMAFNETFSILTTNGHDAFYILTPHMMDYIMQVEKRAGGRLFIQFQQSRVHIAINSGHNLFEVGTTRDLNELRTKFKEEVEYLTDIIDELRLQNTLFKKEGH